LIRPGKNSGSASALSTGPLEGPLTTGRLFFLANKQFLIDTGSSYSLLPYRSKAAPFGPLLKAANDQCIRCWGTCTVTVTVGGNKYSWRFIRADVRFPILGVDFLQNFWLVVDVTAEQLIPSSAAVAQHAAGAQPGFTAAAAVSDSWQELLAEFPGTRQPLDSRCQPSHGVQHQIVTDGPPTAAKFRRLDSTKMAAAKVEFDKMLRAGIIRCSSSQWSSPLHMVRKKDGSWRPCGDYRRLNLVTRKDKYPLPNMADLSGRLDGCVIFSKLDLRKGYLQVPVAAADIPKAAITTPFGLFEFTRMPFGLRNAGMTFQRLMDKIFFDMPAAFGYLDDLLIGSKSAVEHRLHIREVLQRLQQNGLLLNEEKCVFGQSRVNFL
jgi:hypothetical protein